MAPPESFEKRQRERRKQRKRMEKLERRLLRNADKRLGRDGKEHCVILTLSRRNAELRIDSEVWLCSLNLAASQGWVPAQAHRVGLEGAISYARPMGMDISNEDAANLAQALEAELQTIEEEQLEFSGYEFGEEHTETLLALRVEGQRIAEEDVIAARELLSGNAKRHAERLLNFFRGGAFAVD